MGRKTCVDISGKKFGRLTAIKNIGHDKYRKFTWLFKCDCGNLKEISTYLVIRGDIKSCGCLQKEMIINQRGKNNHNYKGYEEMSGAYFSGMVKRSAKKRNLLFEITPKYVWELFLKQNEKCNISGRIIQMGNAVDKEQTASLDRIDSSKGYVIGNVQWLHKDVNFAKQSMSDKDFITMCREIVNYQNEILVDKILKK